MKAKKPFDRIQFIQAHIPRAATALAAVVVGAAIVTGLAWLLALAVPPCLVALAFEV